MTVVWYALTLFPSRSKYSSLVAYLVHRQRVLPDDSFNGLHRAGTSLWVACSGGFSVLEHGNTSEPGVRSFLLERCLQHRAPRRKLCARVPKRKPMPTTLRDKLREQVRHMGA